MTARKFYALWTTRNGQRFWAGPFRTNTAAAAHLRMITDTSGGSLITTTQKAVEPADVTRALRVLFPRPVRLETRAAGPGRFTTTLPAPCARQLGVDVTRDIAGPWLTRRLGIRVTVEGCEFPPRRNGYPARAVITISTAGGTP